MKMLSVLAGGPPFRRLFLDSMVVEESSNLRRVFHAATKYKGNPIFTKEKEWEGWGPSLGGTVIRDGDKLRMYYYCISDTDKTKVRVAESMDGIHWTRPAVGVQVAWSWDLINWTRKPSSASGMPTSTPISPTTLTSR